MPINSSSAFLKVLSDPYDSQALFEHLAGPVCRVPVSDLKELLGKTRYINKNLYEILTSTDLTRAGEELELDPEAWDRVEKALLNLARYQSSARELGVAAALEEFLREAGNHGPSRKILHVDMDQFYAAVEIRDNPALRGKPVIIGADPEGGKGRGVVSTASYEARAFGVHSAMPVSTAFRLCPQGVFLRGDMDKYARVSEQIFAIFESVTPLVEGLSLDEAFLDVTGSTLLFGDAETIARLVKDRIKSELGLVASVGLASNKSVAKIASDIKKPDALVVVPEGSEAEFLKGLPLKRLWGVGPKAEEELHALGLRSVGDLQRYPLAALRARYGEHASGLQELALGIDGREVIPEHAAKSIGRETTFGEDIRDLELLRATLAGLCEDVARRLRRHEFSAAQLSLKFRWTGFETHTRQQRLDPASSHGPDLFGAALPMMERFLKNDRRAVRLIGIQAGKLLRKGEVIQEGLFTRGSDKKDRLDAALDRINDRYGDESLKRANQE